MSDTLETLKAKGYVRGADGSLSRPDSVFAKSDPLNRAAILARYPQIEGASQILSPAGKAQTLEKLLRLGKNQSQICR